MIVSYLPSSQAESRADRADTAYTIATAGTEGFLKMLPSTSSLSDRVESKGMSS